MKPPENKINLVALLPALERVIEGLKQSELHDADVAQLDLYWALEPGELFDPAADPELAALGSLTDDLAELRALLSDPDRAATWMDLRRVGYLCLACSAALAAGSDQAA